MADPDLQLTPVPYNPFGFDDQLNDWKANGQRSILSPQPAAQPSSGDADPAQQARDVAAQRLGRGIMGQQQPRDIRETIWLRGAA
jgi:hypothetical protein